LATEVDLERFSSCRKSGPVRVAWYDDRPEAVQEIAARLREEGFEVSLVDEPQDLVQLVEDGLSQGEPRRVPDVCITDLQIERSTRNYGANYDGVRVATAVNSQYDTRMHVPARLGVASRWLDRIQRVPEDLFSFKFLTSDLDLEGGGKFVEFRRRIEQSAVSLWVDDWCVKYMDRVPVHGYDGNPQFRREAFLFGYIVKVERLSSIVWLWNPQKVGSGRLYHVDVDYLKQRKISETQQPFRVVSFIDLEQNQAEIKVVVPLTDAGDFRFDKVRPQTDELGFGAAEE
jgi:hypothetical protein